MGGDIRDFVVILRNAREYYYPEWHRYEDLVLSTFEEITSIIMKNYDKNRVNPEEILNILNRLPREIKEMLYYTHPKYSKSEQMKAIKLILEDSNFRKVLTIGASLTSLDELYQDLLQELKNVSIPEIYVGISIISTWLSIVNPNYFIPIHKKTVSQDLIKRLTGIEILWGHQWRKYVHNYLRFVELVNYVKDHINAKTAFEVAFYLKKISTNNINNKDNKSFHITVNTIINQPLIEFYFRKFNYLYPKDLIAQFYVALKTKGFVILSGLTGTGKTKLALKFVDLLYPEEGERYHIFLSVRPDWRDPKPLLGFYNPMKEEYHKTPLLEFILRAIKDYEENGKDAMPHFIILDEMNLAHVEYYFADFLSVLESGRDEKGFTRESIKLHNIDKVEDKQGIPKEIKLPPNLYIIGTVNIDETTYMFSPKVLDRAFTIELRDVKLENYPPESISTTKGHITNLRAKILEDLRRGGKFTAIDKKEVLEALKLVKEKGYWKILLQLNKVLEPYDLHFGYRVVDEISLFFKNAIESREKGIINISEDEILDLAILMKVLPKFHGNRRRLEEPLKDLLNLCLKEKATIDELDFSKVKELLKNWEKKKEMFRFKHTAKKVLRMLRQLYEVGFTSFS
ncbi:McrB family protein [Pyrococcus sp. ST04]|uniref:McrB family protein n=1 Tax=Pyrococcus sp. ST04 TaxID=1183377 RepID=UPI0002605CDE|nr:hypothetical protein [Pyrococcus sp. ST04]AFK22416.1 hypothetical protein Py04_0824 [Pyrococcus sp. ST04]